MKLSFERVLPNDDDRIFQVYEIIRISGKRMYKEKGLPHWRTPYPIESIQKDCEEKEVYLVNDIETGMYVHTFQLEFACNTSNHNDLKEGLAIINKFATVPEMSGKGIGKLSMDYIEEHCRNKGVSKISLEVYNKSDRAIQFYKNRGFNIIGDMPTRHFTVNQMEKQL